MQNDAGLCTPFWTPKMADVSTVLEKDTPDVIVRRENELSYEVHKVDLKTKGGQNH